ncbi:LITAF-like zinc ribbon domain [Popillia japonica]|uniref:LITAF-like zinc ribbon domain n=1 Tax=Popillia japonica TaxID=7064 RepID=A0AAW1K571_POPJA
MAEKEPPGTTVVIHGGNYGPSSQQVVCPNCHNRVYTVVKAEVSRRTHIIVILLCVFLCWPCALIPYCIDSCKNKNHYCPSCGSYLGTYYN